MADAAASSDAVGNWGIPCGLVYVLFRVSTAVAHKGHTGQAGHSRPSRSSRGHASSSDFRHSRCAAPRTGQWQSRFGEVSKIASSCYGVADTSQAVVCGAVRCGAVRCGAELEQVRGEDVQW